MSAETISAGWVSMPPLANRKPMAGRMTAIDTVRLMASDGRSRSLRARMARRSGAAVSPVSAGGVSKCFPGHRKIVPASMTSKASVGGSALIVSEKPI
ncbi:hypothetical protein D3C80_1856950 [compost metagenome]